MLNVVIECLEVSSLWNKPILLKFGNLGLLKDGCLYLAELRDLFTVNASTFGLANLIFIFIFF